MASSTAVELVGTELEIEIDVVAHGGHFVGRHDGRVVFVRHTLPGERVRVRVTEGHEDSSFLRADAIEVVRPAAGRVPAPCPVSGPGGCGGCDFQHVDLPTQRQLLTEVVREQLQRLAGITSDVEVEPVPLRAGADDGLGWRTRVDFSVDDDARLALHRHRSHELIAVDPCPIAHPALAEFTAMAWEGADRVETVVASDRELTAVVHGPSGRSVVGPAHVRERVREHDFRVSGSGFWQVHPGAAEVLVDAVLAAADLPAGGRVADLYAGVGLFTAFLADAVGPLGVVYSVEGDARAMRDARRNLHDQPAARLVQAPVDRALRRGDVQGPLDAVVLDPPRVGARARVVRQIARLAPRRVVYIACDPAALARDLATFAVEGYELAGLRAFDIFPMTHHVECVALLVQTGSDLR